MPEPAVVEQDVWHDLQPVLDLELSRLPDKYRAVLILSDLEGKTRGEAARQLGLPEGTVASRLARARAMLAKRLAQRGVALSAGVLAAVLARNAASAGVPTSVVSSTIQAASVFVAGQAATGLMSVKVAVLTEGVLKAMLLTKLKSATAVLLLVGLVGAGGLVYRTQGEPRTDGTGHEYALVKEEKTAKGRDAARQGQQPLTVKPPDPLNGAGVDPVQGDLDLEKAIEMGAWICPRPGDPESLMKFIERVQTERRKQTAPAAPIAMTPDRLKDLLKRGDLGEPTFRCPMGGPLDLKALTELEKALKLCQEKPGNT